MHSYCVQQGLKGIFLATFSRLRVAAFDTFGQLCCPGGGEFDSFFFTFQNIHPTFQNIHPMPDTLFPARGA